MSLAFGDIYRKADLLAAMRHLIQVTMFPNMNEHAKEQVLNQLAWFDRRTETMDLTCKFETMPETRTMRLTVEVGLRSETVQ